MKTMKIIDIFNKIANGEEIPKKIKYKNKIYEWKEYDVCYGKTMTKIGWTKDKGYVAEENKTYFYLKHCYQNLNDEVEIIEEQKKIPEKFKVHSLGDKDENGNFVSSPFPTDKEFMNKINEIIDCLDYLKSKGDE